MYGKLLNINHNILINLSHNIFLLSVQITRTMKVNSVLLLIELCG